jgi:hypothetical protein
MNKYAYALVREIRNRLEDDSKIDFEMKIGDLISDDFDEIDWFFVISELECLYGIEVPKDLLNERELTILELGAIMSELPKVPEYIYPEFLYLKRQILHSLLKIVQISQENDSDENIKVLEEQLELLQLRLNEITNVSMN